jgi:predicted nucleotidyltransferase
MDFHDYLDDKFGLKNFTDQNDVQALFVCDNGSHSWGYASPTSDWDIKFVYIHNDRNKYLGLNEPMQHMTRDMQPLQNVCYVGYDVRKFLGLLSKGNANAYEMVASNCIRRVFPTGKACQLIDFSFAVSRENLDRILAHYAGLAGTTYKKSGEPTYKKWFYIVRPILAVEYIHMVKDLPPLNFLSLLDWSLKYNVIPMSLYYTLSVIHDRRSKGLEDDNTLNINELDEFCQRKIKQWHDYLNDNKDTLYKGEKVLTNPETFDKMYRELIR